MAHPPAHDPRVDAKRPPVGAGRALGRVQGIDLWYSTTATKIEQDTPLSTPVLRCLIVAATS